MSGSPVGGAKSDLWGGRTGERTGEKYRVVLLGVPPAGDGRWFDRWIGSGGLWRKGGCMIGGVDKPVGISPR